MPPVAIRLLVREKYRIRTGRKTPEKATAEPLEHLQLHCF
jgi:hypothetical protein